MLSRSNSSAGDRSRRAKSTSSAHTSSSGHQRQTTYIDPFTSRQHAEAAAVEAYERARQSDNLATRPRPQRRRSHKTGKSEGGHFEDARKRALARSDEVSRARHSQTQQAPISSRPGTSASGEQRVITRKRSVIPPLTEPARTHVEQPSPIPTSDRRGRRRQSTLADGSPAPRYGLIPKEQDATLQLRYAAATSSDALGGTSSHIAEDAHRPEYATQKSSHSRPSTRETAQLGGEALNDGRDRCFQDFQTKRIRERKSFILAPFQKRRTHNVAGNFDNSLPPFNYADNDDAPPIPQNLAAPTVFIRTEQKARNFSETLKDRLRRVFRKSSRTSSEMPLQHIEGPEFHFTVRDTDLSDVDDSFVDYADPFMTIAAEDPTPSRQSKFYNNHANSSAENATIKSRVTSWTNSTLAGGSTIRTNNGPFATFDGPSDSVQHDTGRTLRKASSFWNRPIQNRLRRTSKAELKESAESQNLYDALQKRIRPSRSMEPSNETTFTSSQEEPSSRMSSTLADLPSQRECNMSQSSRTSLSIRQVTSQDPAAYAVDVPSPVKEVMGPEPDAGFNDTVITYHNDDDSKKSTPRSDLKRRPAIKAQPPSHEQLCRRSERSKNRWKSPLDELSPQRPRPAKADMDDNPYELRSLSQVMRQTTPETNLPHHTRVREESHIARAGALSPSVYSRATDGASPRPLTPEDLGLTTITITGREVRRYDISPPKPVQVERSHASRDWRRWLSDEMSNFGVGKEEGDPNAKATAGPLPQDNEAHPVKSTPLGFNATGPECLSRPGSVSPAISEGPGDPKTVRSRADSNASSSMNDRYPVIQNSRHSSRRSTTTARKVSRSGSAEPQVLESRAANRNPSRETFQQTAVKKRDRTLSTESIAEYDVTGLIQSTIASQHVKEGALTANSVDNLQSSRQSAASTRATDTHTAKTVNRPKSAYELRVNYRNAASAKAKPLEVRRKAIEGNLLEDNTIRNISAGPYAIRRLESPNQENSRPMESPLPAVSSSEWLAAGTKKRKEVRKASSMHPLARPLSRSSPQCDPKRSPGQRMVTNWLDERKSRENTPAFV